MIRAASILASLWVHAAFAQGPYQTQKYADEALRRYDEGDYVASRILCDEVLKKEPRHAPIRELSQRNLRQLDRMAQEAFLLGLELERLAQIPQAIRQWERAASFVKRGDPLFDRIQAKREKYP